MPVQPGAVPDGAELAIAAWNLMGGVDWAALPILVELLGVTDVEQLVRQLAAIREFNKSEG